MTWLHPASSAFILLRLLYDYRSFNPASAAPGMPIKITKRTVDAAKPGARDVFLWDEDTKGFGLKVTPSGSKVYVLQYRPKGAVRTAAPKRVTIGKHGSPWTPDTARDEAVRLLGLVADRRDPAAELAAEKARTAEEAADSFNAMLDAFTERYLKKKSKAHWPETRRTLDFDAGRAWGSRPVASISKRDVVRLLDEVMDRPRKRRKGEVGDGDMVKGSPVQANRLHTALKTFFGWCVSTGRLEASPMDHVARPAEESTRERVLDDWELRLVWRASETLGYPFGPLFRLLILTLQRRDEVGGLHRSELSAGALGEGPMPDRPVWVIPSKRAKNSRIHDVPLSADAVALLRAMPWPHDLAFTTTGDTPASGFSRAKDRLDAAITELRRAEAAATGEDAGSVGPLNHWTLHDLRRTGATALAAMGIGEHVTEKLLNHQPKVQRGVAGIYNRHSYLEERRAALEAWARRVNAIATGADGSNIVKLRA